MPSVAPLSLPNVLEPRYSPHSFDATQSLSRASAAQSSCNPERDFCLVRRKETCSAQQQIRTGEAKTDIDKPENCPEATDTGRTNDRPSKLRLSHRTLTLGENANCIRSTNRNSCSKSSATPIKVDVCNPLSAPVHHVGRLPHLSQRQQTQVPNLLRQMPLWTDQVHHPPPLPTLSLGHLTTSSDSL